jgi:hypothetical protein
MQTEISPLVPFILRYPGPQIFSERSIQLWLDDSFDGALEEAGF